MEVRGETLWDGATPFASLVPSRNAARAVSLQLATPVVLGRDRVVAIVDALTAAGIPALDGGDELIRHTPRHAGWTGALRAPLAAPRGAPSVVEPAAAVQALLPGTEVIRRGLSRSVAVLPLERH